MRVGRGRLVTGQAWGKNWKVLLEWFAAVAADILVINVFNFFLSVLVERQIKGIQFCF